MEEELLPHFWSRDSNARLAEERRLLYVGMTRAKERLFLSWSRWRWQWIAWCAPASAHLALVLAETPRKDLFSILNRSTMLKAGGSNSVRKPWRQTSTLHPPSDVYHRRQ